MGQGAASLLHSPNASSYTSLESFISYFPFPLSTVIPPKFNPEPHKYGCALITWQQLPTTALCCPKSHCKLLYMGCFHLYFAVVLFNGRKVSFPLLSLYSVLPGVFTTLIFLAANILLHLNTVEDSKKRNLTKNYFGVTIHRELQLQIIKLQEHDSIYQAIITEGY